MAAKGPRNAAPFFCAKNVACVRSCRPGGSTAPRPYRSHVVVTSPHHALIDHEIPVIHATRACVHHRNPSINDRVMDIAGHVPAHPRPAARIRPAGSGHPPPRGGHLPRESARRSVRFGRADARGLSRVHAPLLREEREVSDQRNGDPRQRGGWPWRAGEPRPSSVASSAASRRRHRAGARPRHHAVRAHPVQKVHEGFSSRCRDPSPIPPPYARPSAHSDAHEGVPP
jgi:hypothetical protein